MTDSDGDWFEQLLTEDRERTPEERERERLKDYLSYPRWRADQAVFILIGIDPELSPDPTAGFCKWLPGISESWRCMDAFALGKHVELELEDVGSFVKGEARRPFEWIAHALSKAYPPPWLEIARADEELNLLLQQGNDLAPSAARRRAAFAMHDQSDAGKAKRQLLEAWDSRCTAFCADNDILQFQIEMLNAYKAVPQRSIKDWIRELKKEWAGGHAPDWAKRFRQERKKFPSA